MRPFLFTSTTFILLLPFSAAAEDLFQVYRDAQRYDAAYSSARQTLEAGREKLPQGRALVLPTLNLTGSATRSRFDIDSNDPAVSASFVRSTNAASYTLTLTQPLYRPQSLLQYEQGEYQVRQAEATFALAYQDLVIRVAQAYFDGLAATDTLNLVRAQKAAISEQLAQAKRNFEVGTATITDTHEAQARFDLSAAQEIAAINDLESKQRSLQQLTGKVYTELKHLRLDIKLSPPNPKDMESWVQLAEKQNYTVQQQEAAGEVARREARRASAAHRPTLDIVGTVGQSTDTGTATTAVGRDINSASIGLQLSLPIYQGGSLSSKEREAAALSLKARDDLENSRRQAALTARQTYLAVINGIAQVGALEQALISSQSALDSNRLGYEVGVRINIDVLNAQQQLFSTRRDLAVARYNTITNQLRLKAAAGSLREEDLEEINRALAQ
ncbi:MAG TPA: TolC family outer membrane protein [Burkholderiales bacterium]|nr:TolC family outer membrane protein [Burkholderiales bacterium]